MDIQHTDDGKKGHFFILTDGQISAEMSYVWAGENKIIIDHTEVDDRWRGKSVGKQLLDKVVTLAREKHLKIIPLCPFAKSVFDKTEALRDVL